MHNRIMNKIVKKIGFYARADNKEARKWQGKISAWMAKSYPKIKISDKKPDSIIVLGGDGTIMEAARKYAGTGAVILGLNLGQVGFLVSVEDQEKFLPAVARFFAGDYKLSPRLIINGEVTRAGKKVFSSDAFNEITVQNLLGMVELDVKIGGSIVQNIRGSGALVSTSSGSTAYNLSAHGPIVAPDLHCLIVTELLDHNVPTPSLVVRDKSAVTIRVKNFREHGALKIAATDKSADVLFIADGNAIFPLKQDDEVRVSRGKNPVNLVELEPNRFFKSLRNKFTFK